MQKKNKEIFLGGEGTGMGNRNELVGDYEAKLMILYTFWEVQIPEIEKFMLEISSQFTP